MDIKSRREPQTPAYALTGKARRAIDLTYQRAESLRSALPGVVIKTCEVIPINGKYVSGLNVAGNLVTLVGPDAYNRHKRVQRKALKLLEARNG